MTARTNHPVPSDEGPVFTTEEYEDRELDFHEAFERLPVVIPIDGLGVRWMGPLVELALDRVMGDLAEAAYGYLEDSGWRAELEAVSFGPAGLTPPYAAAFARAARRLAKAGAHSGPESDPEVWASWLAFELSSMRELVQSRAAGHGWDR